MNRYEVTVMNRYEVTVMNRYEVTVMNRYEATGLHSYKFTSLLTALEHRLTFTLDQHWENTVGHHKVTKTPRALSNPIGIIYQIPMQTHLENLQNNLSDT